MSDYEIAVISDDIQDEINKLENEIKEVTQRDIILIPYEKLDGSELSQY